MEKANIPEYEMLALQDLYVATNGDNWAWELYLGLPIGAWNFNESQQ